MMFSVVSVVECKVLHTATKNSNMKYILIGFELSETKIEGDLPPALWLF